MRPKLTDVIHFHQIIEPFFAKLQTIDRSSAVSSWCKGMTYNTWKTAMRCDACNVNKRFFCIFELCASILIILAYVVLINRMAFWDYYCKERAETFTIRRVVICYQVCMFNDVKNAVCDEVSMTHARLCLHLRNDLVRRLDLGHHLSGIRVGMSAKSTCMHAFSCHVLYIV